MTTILARETKQDIDRVGDFSKHLLDVDSLSRSQIQDLIEPAREYRQLRSTGPYKSDILRGGSIYTLFFENSTRTRVSFEHAGKALGADVINISASTSSVNKGESLLNTALTLDAMGVGALVMRHPHSGAPHFRFPPHERGCHQCRRRCAWAPDASPVGRNDVTGPNR